jgi:glycosyltransferase involved in cell wall biosynthesis
VKSKHIVIIYNEDPFARDFGGNLRVRHLIKELSKHMKVSLINLPAPTAKQPKQLSFKAYLDKTIRKILNLVNNKPQTVNRHYYQIPKLNNKIQKFLKQNQVDFIQVEHSYFGEVLDHNDNRYFKILDFHNVHTYMDNHRSEQDKWRKFESGLMNKYNLALCCSETEKQRLELLGFENIYVLQNGINSNNESKKYLQYQPKKLLFVGDMTYGPNKHAMKRFIQNIMPKLQSNLPLTIIGKYHKKDFRKELKIKGVQFLGYLDNINHQYENSIFVCPVNEGGGTRFKILEAFIHGTPVISYAKGAEGIEYTHLDNILIANSHREFANAIELLCKDADIYQSISANAFQLAKAKYDLTEIVKNYADFLNTL